MPPLDGCTYEGIDNGSQPNEVNRSRVSSIDVFVVVVVAVRFVLVVALFRFSSRRMYGDFLRTISLDVCPTDAALVDTTIENMSLAASSRENTIDMR
jgi:hypothetical protein